ncbi:MAG: hypothetical protein A6F72_08585 [Cycloclasticus sp. symbiont of Poecilosclerida sp. N]|nr:MAG: hypothetical protein A6F72_08585 [Cycloclasticus sp. symbiont of Poecilosclerida sp. N]
MGFLLLVAAGFYGFGPHEHLDLTALKDKSASFIAYYEVNPWQTRLWFFLIYILTAVVSISGASVLILAGGAVFGLWWGIVLVLFASLIFALVKNNARTALQDGLDVKQMLNNSSFLIPLNVAGDNNDGVNNMTLWGRGDYLNLSDDAFGVDWEGAIVGGSVGIDARLSRNLAAGAAASYSEDDKESAGVWPSKAQWQGVYSGHPLMRRPIH